MINRYNDKNIFINNFEQYEKLFRDRNVNLIKQYATPNFPPIEPNSLGRISLEQHMWQLGDKFYKLAYKYYGDANDWWVIAQFNNKPTESHIKVGEIILIPTPIGEIVKVLKG